MTRSSASSRRDTQPASSVDATKLREVRVTGAKPPTEEQRRELRALAERPDSEIDLSDIPEWTEADFARAVRGLFYHRPTKSQLTVRLDNDLLAWLKAKGPGYQTRINAILRRAMLRDIAGR